MMSVGGTPAREGRAQPHTADTTLVVCPIYNEARYLSDVLEEIKTHIGPSVDILAIDDGSTDDTPRLLREVNGVRVLTHRKNLGYGRTLIDGFRYAGRRRYRYIVTIDCDWQHEPHLIQTFCMHVEHYDIVSGSRYMRPSNEAPPAERFAINREITALINEITGYGITDAFCGFKAYRVERLNKLRLTEPGYGMPVQLWLEAWKHGLTVKELPVALVYFDHTRTFPGRLRDAENRLRYYRSIMERELGDGRRARFRRTS